MPNPSTVARTIGPRQTQVAPSLQQVSGASPLTLRIEQLELLSRLTEFDFATLARGRDGKPGKWIVERLKAVITDDARYVEIRKLETAMRIARAHLRDAAVDASTSRLTQAVGMAETLVPTARRASDPQLARKPDNNGWGRLRRQLTEEEQLIAEEQAAQAAAAKAHLKIGDANTQLRRPSPHGVVVPSTKKKGKKK